MDKEKGRNSGGKASVWLGVIAILLWVFVIVFAGAWMRKDPENAQLMVILTVIVLVTLATNIVGLVFGVIGLFKKNNKKTLAVTGVILNSIGFGWMIFVYLLDYVAQRL